MSDLDPALARAAALLDVDRPDQALAELARLPTALATDPTTFQLRAEALIALDRWADAAETARHGLAAGGPDPRLLAQLGLALHALGRNPEAERAYLDGLALAPSDVVLLCRYALLCLSVGQLDKAGKLLASATNENPYAPIVYGTRIELAYARGHDRQAERFSRDFLAEYPQHPLALAMHGRSAALRGRIALAYGSYRQAVAAKPADPDTVEVAQQLRVAAHPLLAPLRPLYRLGPFKSWLIAVGLILTLQLIGWTIPSVVAAFAWMLYAGYSWVAPSIVRRLAGGAARGAESRGVRVLRWVVGSVVLLVGLACTGLSAVDIGPAVQAALGQGTPGTIVLTRQDCQARSCDWYGDFTSDDGSAVFPDAAMQEGVPAEAKVGDRLRARHTGARDGVYPETGSREWIFIVLFLVVGVILVVGWVLAIPVPALLRRLRR